jgi:hypothetical protein
MTSGESAYLIGAFIAFLAFAAAVAWTDVSTRDAREKNTPGRH